MLIRTVHGVAVIVLLAALAWWQAAHTDPTLASAAALRGERWYRLMLGNRHVGYLHTLTRRDPRGRWRFDSDLRFALSEGNPVRIDERLLFDGSPPYDLLRGRQQRDDSDVPEDTRLERRGSGYAVHGTDTESAGEAARMLDLRFTLRDYLGFETWLRRTDPPPGATVGVRALDFAARRTRLRQVRVLERNGTGYRLENAAPGDSTRIQLDHQLRPVAMTLAGTFELQQVSKSEALAPRTALQAASYFVPTDRPLPDPARVRSLELEVVGGITADELWPTLADGNLLHRTAGAVSIPRREGNELAETADYPTANRRIRRLAQQAVAGLSDPWQQAAALTRFVHGYLHYVDDGVRHHVLTLLDEPAGDCSEYADLLTTLARSVGIPARTVFGLVYSDATDASASNARAPAFRFHAWNELEADGTWHAVDPTWDQLEVDATHIPMPEDTARALELLTGGLSIRFRIRDVQYFTSDVGSAPPGSPTPPARRRG